jgi:hypothetical protein
MSLRRQTSSPAARLVAAALAVAAATALAAVSDALAAGPLAALGATRAPAIAKPVAAATLEGCQTASVQAERSATFAGEMTAVTGTTRMLMRIDVLERSAGEVDFRTVTYPGLDNWLRAAAGVKTYKNLDRVTDLGAPAEYRAEIRFRWLGSRGRLLRTSVLHTPVCTETAGGSEEAAAGSTSTPAT